MKSGLAPKYSNDQFSKAKVTQLSSLKEVIENIKKRLNTNQMKLFSESCFGHFLKMHDIKFSGALVHHFLLRQMKSQRTGEMWFTFGGKQARFGKTEFCLISGLSFGEPLGSGNRRFPRTTRLQHECFNGEKNITVATLQDMFMKCSTWSDEDTIKVALLYFLYFVLLGEERRLLVDDFHLELVDCLDTFNSYPWGSVSFDKTLSDLQNAFNHRKCLSVNKQSKLKSVYQKTRVKSLQKASTTYTLHGFPYAFQVYKTFEGVVGLLFVPSVLFFYLKCFVS